MNLLWATTSPDVIRGPAPSVPSQASWHHGAPAWAFLAPGHIPGHAGMIPWALPAPVHCDHTALFVTAWTSHSLMHLSLRYCLCDSLGKAWRRPSLSPCLRMTTATTNLYKELQALNYSEYFMYIHSSNLMTDVIETWFLSTWPCSLNSSPLFFSPVLCRMSGSQSERRFFHLLIVPISKFPPVDFSISKGKGYCTQRTGRHVVSLC